jgi:hypothetical protein
MGSGIVSVDLSSGHQQVLSAVMLWFAAGAWLRRSPMCDMRMPGVIVYD